MPLLQTFLHIHNHDELALGMKSCTSFPVLGMPLPEFIPHYSKNQNMTMPNNKNISWHCGTGGHSHMSKCLALHTEDTQ